MREAYRSRLALERLESRLCLSAGPELIEDLNQQPMDHHSVVPSGFYSAGADVFFFEPIDSRRDMDLWRVHDADSTLVSTVENSASIVGDLGNNLVLRVVKELLITGPTGLSQLSANVSRSSRFFDLGERIAFTTEGRGEAAIWTTDGTVAGTEVIREYVTDASIRHINEQLYFEAQTVTGHAPFFAQWRTDGTVAGTQNVDAFPGDIENPATGDRFTGSIRDDGLQASQPYFSWLSRVHRGAMHAVVGRDLFVVGNSEVWHVPPDPISHPQHFITADRKISGIYAFGDSLIVTSLSGVWKTSVDVAQWQLVHGTSAKIVVADDGWFYLQSGSRLLAMDGSIRSSLMPEVVSESATNMHLHNGQIVFRQFAERRHTVQRFSPTTRGELLFTRRNTESFYPVAVHAFKEQLIVEGRSYTDLVTNDDSDWNLIASHIFGHQQPKLLGVFEDSVLITDGKSIRMLQGRRQIVGWPAAPRSPRTLSQGDSNILLANRFDGFEGSIFGANLDGTDFQSLDLFSPLSLKLTGVYAGPSYYFFASETRGGPIAIYRSDGTKRRTEKLITYDELPGPPRHLVASDGIAYFLTQSSTGLHVWAIHDELSRPRVVASLPGASLSWSDHVLSTVRGNFVLSYSGGVFIGNSLGEVILDESDFRVEATFGDEVVLWKLGFGVSPRIWITDQLQLGKRKTIDAARASDFHSVNGKLFFNTPGATWESDGTADGTEMILPMVRQVLHADDDFVYFADHDAEHGVELWRDERRPRNRADFNQDGNVDFADFLIVSSNFGQRGEFQSGDTDGSGTIDFRDFLIVSKSFMNRTST